MTKRVALGFAGPYPALRGSQMLVRQLEQGLRSRGHQVSVVSHGPETSPLPRLGAGRVTRGLGLAWRLWQTARRDRIDVIHAHNYEAALVALPIGRLLGIPVVFHGHAAYGDELPTYVSRRWRGLARWIGERLDRQVPRMAAAVLTVTPGLANRLVSKGLARAGVEWIPPALPLAEVAAALHGPEHANQICYTGNLDGYQNLELLHAAFAQVQAEIATARLLVVTDDPVPCGGRLAEVPGLEFRCGGDLETTRQALAAAAILVLPRTDATGFPMKLLNYRAAGKAIVVSHGAAHGLRDGVEALVVPDGDPDAFAQAIIRVLRDDGLRHRLGAAARRLAEDPIPVGQALDRIESTYRRVLVRAPARLAAVPQPE